MRFEEKLAEKMRAGYQLFLIPTHEELRCLRAVRAMMEADSRLRQYRLRGWDSARGMWDATDLTEQPSPDKTLEQQFRIIKADTDGMSMLSTVRKEVEAVTVSGQGGDKGAIIAMCDSDYLFADFEFVRQLRHLVVNNMLNRQVVPRPILLIQSSERVHPELAKHVTIVDFSLPTKEELEVAFDYLAGGVKKGKETITIDANIRDAICIAGRGLTQAEFEDVLGLGIRRHKGVVLEIVDMIEDEKAALLRASTALEYVPKSKIESIDQFAGIEGYMDFIRIRAAAYSRAGREAGLEAPKGVVLVGAPGTGKSAFGMATAKAIGDIADRPFPLIIMDVGALFGSLVGESEERTRDALRTVDAHGGAVLMLDEADKAFSGAAESTGDSGVSRRMFGQILTWLGRKETETFVVVTMNRVDGIPPEFLRKGRFDEVFYVGLPDAATRRRIFEIHLQKRGMSFDSLELHDTEIDNLVSSTENFVGAEIESAVRESMYLAFARRGNKNPTAADIIAAIKAMRPLWQLDEAGMKKIADFGNSRARPVTIQGATNVGAPPESKRRGSRRNVDVD